MPVEENITEVQDTQEAPSEVVTTEEVPVAEATEEINLAEILD